MIGQLSLNTVPQEVLEQIAFFSGTDIFLGPPSSLISLLLTSRHVNESLSIACNHHLYARIFSFKFDTAAAHARLGANRLTSCALADELRRRCIVLKRLRAKKDSTIRARHEDNDEHKMSLHEVLFAAYILVLENEGRNKRQLVEYGRMKDWIREFWFDPNGSSLALYRIRTGQWPPNVPQTALGMWLFWFLLNTDDYRTLNDDQPPDAPDSPENVLKVLALGAHLYNVTATPWAEFEPKMKRESHRVTLYSEGMDATPPPLATPAILSYLTIAGKRRSIPLPPSDAPRPRQASREWDSEWGRCFANSKRGFTGCFRPGSIEGVWEGFFTYTDFGSYAAILGGAPPSIIQKCLVGKHQQTWKLREHHLLATDSSGSDSGIDMDMEVDSDAPLRGGDPLRSYFPTGTQIRETRDGLIVKEATTGRILKYQKPQAFEASCEDAEDLEARVRDIIITGEGHSAWGQFNLVGRIRPGDGFVSLSKDYADGDRGKWLYRGYLVGNENGNFGGRWRDTLSPADVPGYEGCFVMSRRR